MKAKITFEVEISEKEITKIRKRIENELKSKWIKSPQKTIDGMILEDIAFKMFDSSLNLESINKKYIKKIKLRTNSIKFNRIKKFKCVK